MITSQFRFVAESNFRVELENGCLDQPKEIDLNTTVYYWAVYSEGTKIKRKQEEAVEEGATAYSPNWLDYPITAPTDHLIGSDHHTITYAEGSLL